MAMKVLLLSRYDQLGASSRVRSLQYLPLLESSGIEVTTSPLFDNKYISNLCAGNQISIKSLLYAIAGRLKSMMRKTEYDLIWVESEMLPWLPEWMESILVGHRLPWIVDYDDAIFHRYDQHKSMVVRALLAHKIDALMAHSSLVLTGNKYLASRAKTAGAARVEILPSVIDLKKYTHPAITGEVDIHHHKDFVLGWMGSPVTKKYLLVIQDALQEVCVSDQVRLILVGSGNFHLAGVQPEIRSWTEASEVEELRTFDVGIMPLTDDDWSRGKCGYKLIQYMACSLPVIASPVGANTDIVEDGVNGILASSSEEWVAAIRTLKNDRDLGMRMGINGRKRVEAKYCLQKTAPILANLMYETVAAS
ncbi:MAG: glycosyltransferase family 4 protein [Thermoleophilia bacterium]